MSLLGRARLVLRSSVGALLAPADDPRQTGFAFAYQRQAELLAKVRASLEQLASGRQRLDARAAELAEQLPALEEAARNAVVGGREDRALATLRQRRLAISHLESLRAQSRQIEGEQAALALIEQRLSTQIEAFYARQEVIAANLSAADAQVRINEALSGISQELADFGMALESAENNMLGAQARAGALEELMDTGLLETTPFFGPADEGAVRADYQALVAEFQRALPGDAP